jgi:hypothetical protein
MTYAENSGNVSLSGTNTLLQSLTGYGVTLSPSLDRAFQSALDCLTTNGSACADALTLRSTGEVTVTIADYDLKLNLTNFGTLNAYVDFNADGDFGDSGEAAIVELDLSAYGADYWQVNLLHAGDANPVTPGATPTTGSGTSLTDPKPEPPMTPGSGTSLTDPKPEPPMTPPVVVTPPPVVVTPPPVVVTPPPVLVTPPPTTGGGTFEVPGTNGGGGTPSTGNRPPIFIVPGTPSIIAGVNGAVVGAIEVIDPDTTGYTFNVLNGTQSVGGNRVIDNRFIVENGELRLNSNISIATGSSDALNLVIEIVDGAGNAFRSSNLNVFVNNGTIQVGGAGAGNTVIYTEGAAPVTLASNLSLVGGAGGPAQINGATVRIGDNYAAGQDFLRVGAGAATSGTLNGLTWNFNAANGTLTFTGAAPLATYEAALQQVSYFNNSQNPSTLGRTISFAIGGGAAPLGQANLVIDIVGVDNPGTFQFPTAPSITAGVAGASVGQILINDPDSFYTLSVGGGFGTQFQIINGANGGQLVLRSGQSITVTGPVTIPIIATDNATGQTLTQDLTFNVVPAASNTFSVTGLSAAGGLPTVNYTEQQGPVVISSGVTLGGIGGVVPALGPNGATVAIGGFSATQQERLGITGQTGNSGAIAGTALTWTYDAATGILSFAGAGSVADYQTALRQVTYSNGSTAPLATRSLTYTVGSGAQSGQGFATIGITSVDSLPTAISLASNRVPTGQPGGVVGAISVVDADGPSDAGSYTFTVSGGGGLFEIVNGQLKLKAGQSVSPGQIIDGISIDLIDAGAPNGGAFSQAANLTTGVGSASEILWRNGGNSQSIFWDVINAREVVGGNILTYGQGIGDARVGQQTAFGANFRTVGLRDMNRDGINDLILTNGPSIIVATIGEVNGRPATVEAQGAPVFANPIFGALNGQAAGPDASSQLLGLEDMNGDGQPDYVFYNTALNQVVIWTTNAQNQIINGFSVTGAGGAATPAAPGKFEALGDFDGDGDKDILWRNGSNVTLWTLNGGQYVSQTALTQLSDPSFVMAGVGDFNNDGRQDVVWRSQLLNATVLWLFGANTAQTLIPPAFTLPATSTAGGIWQIGAVADLDGDGTSDLLWRNNTTDLAVFWRIVNGQLDTANSGPILNRLPNGSSGALPTGDPAWNIAGANGAPRAAATPVVATP